MRIFLINPYENSAFFITQSVKIIRLENIFLKLVRTCLFYALYRDSLKTSKLYICTRSMLFLDSFIVGSFFYFQYSSTLSPFSSDQNVPVVRVPWKLVIGQKMRHHCRISWLLASYLFLNYRKLYAKKK